MREHHLRVNTEHQAMPVTIVEGGITAADVAQGCFAPLIRATVRRQVASISANIYLDEEGICQEAWFKSVQAVQRKPELLSGGNNLGGFIRTLARNSAIDAARCEGKQDNHIDRQIPEEALLRTPDNSAGDDFGRVEVLAVLEQLLTELSRRNPALERTGCLYIASGFDLPLAALAKDLGVSVATASRLRGQVRAYFRRALTS